MDHNVWASMLLKVKVECTDKPKSNATASSLFFPKFIIGSAVVVQLDGTQNFCCGLTTKAAKMLGVELDVYFPAHNVMTTLEFSIHSTRVS